VTAASVIKATIKGFAEDNCWMLAGSIAYFTLLSIFPLILGLLAILGIILQNPATQTHLIADIAGLFPGSSDLIRGTVHAVIVGRGLAGVVATLGLIWSASGMFAALNFSLNAVWGVAEQQSFLVSTLIAIALVFGVGIIFIVLLALSAALQLASKLNLLGMTLGALPILFPLVNLILPLIITFGIFAFIYGVVPNCNLSWPEVWPGALLGSVLFEIGKQAFVFYLGTFANFSAVYGPIGAVVALVTWAYFAALVILIAAEFNKALSPRAGTPSRGKAYGEPPVVRAFESRRYEQHRGA
jgi:membrane protein